MSAFGPLQTSLAALHTSAFDPKRTDGSAAVVHQLQRPLPFSFWSYRRCNQCCRRARKLGGTSCSGVDPCQWA